jgi:hypothetical protein
MAWLVSIARSAALAGLLLSVADSAETRGFGGGGFRGGGSMSMSRGGGFSRGSMGGGSSFGQQGVNSSGGTFSRSGNYNRPSTTDRPGQGGSSTQIGGGDLRPAQLPSGGGGAGSRPGGGDGSSRPIDPSNRPGGGGSGTERPTHPISCPGCGGDGTQGWFDHPIAAGIAIGAVAGAAAAIGSYYYALPPDCPPYYWSELTYYSCGGAWYQPQYEGDTIVYVTVPDPSGGQKPPEQ